MLHRCLMLVKLSFERLILRLRKMAEPSIVKDAASLKHEALSLYKAAAALLQHKVEFPPNGDSTSQAIDEWIDEVYLQWVICSNFWKPTGIKKVSWNDAEYTLLPHLPLVNREHIDESGGRFNELVHQAHKYLIPNLCPVPLDTSSPSPEPELRVQMLTPAPLKTATPPIQKPTTSATNLAVNPLSSNVRAPGSMPFHLFKSPLPNSTTPLPQVQLPFITSKSAQPFNASSSSQSALVKPVDASKSKPPLPPVTLFLGSGKAMVGDNSGPSDSPNAFLKDWTSPLHHKPAQQLKTVSPKETLHSETPTRPSLQILAVNAPDHPNVVPGPNPAQEGTVTQFHSVHGLLFLPEVTGTGGEDGGNFANLLPPPTGAADTDDEGYSPPPIKKAHRLCQDPKISFVFDDTTGDLVDSYPTIFLSRPVAPLSPSPALRCSVCLHALPVNPNSVYLNATQGSKSNVKTKKKGLKRNDKNSEDTVDMLCKCSRM
ncbi:hypothetical protein EDD85DRAFT_952415 [Armillaria nabsnona]|nr:hypothetical protein EDD85DRAFT_952415 [Armillaria nabsnona]